MIRILVLAFAPLLFAYFMYVHELKYELPANGKLSNGDREVGGEESTNVTLTYKCTCTKLDPKIPNYYHGVADATKECCEGRGYVLPDEPLRCQNITDQNLAFGQCCELKVDKAFCVLDKDIPKKHSPSDNPPAKDLPSKDSNGAQ
ncbi:hypothetical protein BJV82DRAFT_588489 [Fennellomyces sp. T-0311]|nr:hypothetical protein BJV82DRAFT_588489 [Fennellomyces sp. T-0311]